MATGHVPLTRARAGPNDGVMCRAIRVLYKLEPATTADALQYVRKVSGLRRPPAVDVETFEKAVDEVATATRHLLSTLRARSAVRTREQEREKARARGARRTAVRPQA